MVRMHSCETRGRVEELEGTRWEQCQTDPAGCHRMPLTLSVFRNRQRRGLRVMRLRDFGRLADLGGPAGPETESKNFRA